MEKKLLLLIVFLVGIIQCGFSQKLSTLRNSKIEVAVDEKGNLVTLKNLATGQNYADGKSLWRLYYDRKIEKDNEVIASENIPTVQVDNNEITISYSKLIHHADELNFKLTLKIILEDELVRFTSEITNNVQHTIVRELQYPLIGNCQVPAGHQLLTTVEGGKIYPDPKKQILSIPFSYMGPDQNFRKMTVKYPAQVASNCFALVGTTQGLYLGSHDSTFQDTWHGLRMYPDKSHNFTELEVGLYKYPSCLFGQTWKNDANVVVPYSGNWHETSKIYRKWANSWWRHREEPLWVKEMIGFQRNIMKHQYGGTLFPYTDFANRIKKAGESVGINVAFPFGWWNSGMDNGYPDSYFVTDPKQGGDAAWKQAIADFKKDGGKVLMYYNGKLIDTESDYYKKGDGKKVCFHNNTGNEIREEYRFFGPGTFTGYYDARTFVVADTKNPKWQRKLYEMADHALYLGANSVFYDQLGYAEAVGNWDVSKEFPIPELRVIYDKGNALKMIHDYIETKDKDFAIGTEHIADYTSQFCDYVHIVTNLSDPYNFLDWFRYTFPEIILSDRNLDGDESDIVWLVNQDVLLGLRNNLQTFRLRGTIDETPEYQQYLAKVNKLKAQYKSLLVMGTYRDTEGFSINDSRLIARSFSDKDQMALVVTQKSAENVSAQVSVPGYRFKESSGIGNNSVVTGSNGIQNVTVGKNGLMVLIYEKNTL